MERKLKSLEVELSNIEAGNPPPLFNDTLNQIQLVKKDINEIMEYKTADAMIRRRTDWLGGEPSSYLLRKEKENYNNKKYLTS